MNEALGHNPEDHELLEIHLADKKFAKEILGEYPPSNKDSKSNSDIDPEHYWGFAMAATCAKLGLPIGFEQRGPIDPTKVTIYGSGESINYWLNLAGYEHRGWRDNMAASESRSGFFTLMHDPSHGELFEHVYALHTNQLIESVIMRDPMFERARFEQMATQAEIVDHEGVENLYKENPTHCLRLYLTDSYLV